MKDVIESGILPGHFDPHDVVRLLHHADDVLIPFSIGAVLANLAVADVPANLAQTKLIFNI
jgi:hypothetical protein